MVRSTPCERYEVMSMWNSTLRFARRALATMTVVTLAAMGLPVVAHADEDDPKVRITQRRDPSSGKIDSTVELDGKTLHERWRLSVGGQEEFYAEDGRGGLAVYTSSGNVVERVTRKSRSFEFGLSALVVNRRAVLTWPRVLGATLYEIDVDGKRAMTTKGTQVNLKSTDNPETYYTVRAIIPLPSSTVVDPRTEEKVTVSNSMSFNTSLRVVLPTTSKADSILRGASDASPAAVYNKTRFKYQTFISPQYVPSIGCGFLQDGYFNGNNRGYSSSSGSFKTRARAETDWINLLSLWYWEAQPTTLYDPSLTPVQTRTASVDETIHAGSILGDSFNYYYTLSSSNPFCPEMGAILYSLDFTVNRYGSYQMSGYRRPVPHHEAYVKFDSKAWRTVLRRGNSGFHCLTGICGTEPL